MASKILWRDGRPELWITGGKSNRYDVENGGYSITLNGLEATIDGRGTKMQFDRITDAPKGEDYNDVLTKALERG